MFTIISVSKISIHAPAKGATVPYIYYNTSIKYFNPRSREGSDGAAKIGREKDPNFNPRSREGSDSNTKGCSVLTIRISIHAPAKGATCAP